MYLIKSSAFGFQSNWSPQLIANSYTNWKKSPTKKNMTQVIKSLEPIINKELNNYRGSIPEIALKGMAKKISVHAIKTYSPVYKAALTTHVTNQLKRLHRKNYESMSVIRLPENVQQGVTGYLTAKQMLEEKLGREPTVAEIGDEMGWHAGHVAKLEKRLRNEIVDKNLVFDPGVIEESPYETKLEFFYHDLTPEEKLIFEHTTGYGGKKIKTKKEIAKMLKITPVQVGRKAKILADNLKKIYARIK